MREINIIAPDSVSDDTTYDFRFQASSTNDAGADLSEITIPVAIDAADSSGVLSIGSDGISEVSGDQLLLYGAIGGGLILLLILLGVVSRSLRKKAAKNNAEENPIDLDESDEGDVKDEFDDLFDDLGNLDINADEFDDLLDEI